MVSDHTLRGRDLCRALSAVTDRWLSELFATSVEHPSGVALLAVGGYGRGELAPGSDLDLWLVHDGRDDVATVAQRLWYPVWDAGLDLGHAVRSVRQAVALAADDLDTATASLSLRHLAGDAALSAELGERALATWRKRSRRWLDELGRRAAVRAEEAGEVAFLLEPDLKEGRGGLRDVGALRWAESARPVLQPGDAEAVAAAEDVLLDARVELHRPPSLGQGRRCTDLLLLERQDEVADALGLPNADALMAGVAAAARTISWTSDEVWGRVASSLAGPLGRIARRDRALGPGLVLREGEVHVLAVDADVEGDGSLVLRAGAAAARTGSRIDRQSLDRLAADAPALDGPWPDAARHALVDLLGAGRPAVAVMEALDQRHLVERVLPEWGPTRSKPQRNALHRFTVDRHLLEAAANAAELTGSVARPDLLLAGAWLHDIGKGGSGDHTVEGMALLSDIAPRIGFDEADTKVLVDLVRHHLLLPDIATRRDIGDAAVVEGVAEAVGSLGTLELLAALTEADSLATGPSAWGSWKAELVAELVDRVAGVLRGEAEAPGRAEGGFPDAGVRQLLATGETVVRGSGPHLTVVAPDRTGLFSRVAGVLSLRGLTVVGADALSDARMAASRFRVDVDDGVVIDWDTVAVEVRRALEGRLALDARLSDRARRPRQAAALTLADAPRVRIDNGASAESTVVEVRAPDGPAVLYRITRALADLDLDIRLAKVATLGAEVLDTFYVRTAGGGKLHDRGHQRELERAILHRLSS